MGFTKFHFGIVGKALLILALAVLVGGCSQSSGSSPNGKAPTKAEVLQEYKKSCAYHYKDLRGLFDKAEKTVDAVWEDDGERPPMPWSDIRDRKLVARYLDQEEFKITRRVPAVGEPMPSKSYHYAFVSYEYAMMYLTGKNFTGADYKKTKAEIASGKKYLEEFRQLCEKVR